MKKQDTTGGYGRANLELQTEVNRIDYDFTTGVARVFMPDLCCCDMGGVVAYFTRIDPAVNEIQTFANEAPGTLYLLGDEGWRSVLLEHSDWLRLWQRSMKRDMASSEQKARVMMKDIQKLEQMIEPATVVHHVYIDNAKKKPH